MKWILLSCYILIFSLIFLSFTVSKSQAASFNVGIYPPVISVTAKPPTSLTTPITIVNQNDQEVAGTIAFRLFTPGSYENGQLIYLPSSTVPAPDKAIFDRIKIAQDGLSVKDIVLAPKQARKLNLEISLPKDEPLADYYFSIIFLSNTSITSSNTSSTAVGGIATNVLLSVGPKGSAKAQIVEFSSPSFLSQGPVPFILRVKNTGEHAIAPTGYILISNMFGQIIGKVNLLPVNILTNSTRSIPDSSNSEAIASSNLFLPSIPVAIWPEKFLLGPYNSTVYLSLSDTGPVLKESTSFFAFPLKLLVLILGFIIITLLIILRIKKKIKQS